jgi:hypothetical protein
MSDGNNKGLAKNFTIDAQSRLISFDWSINGDIPRYS